MKGLGGSGAASACFGRAHGLGGKGASREPCGLAVLVLAAPKVPCGLALLVLAEPKSPCGFAAPVPADPNNPCDLVLLVLVDPNRPCDFSVFVLAAPKAPGLEKMDGLGVCAESLAGPGVVEVSWKGLFSRDCKGVAADFWLGASALEEDDDPPIEYVALLVASGGMGMLSSSTLIVGVCGSLSLLFMVGTEGEALAGAGLGASRNERLLDEDMVSSLPSLGASLSFVGCPKRDVPGAGDMVDVNLVGGVGEDCGVVET